MAAVEGGQCFEVYVKNTGNLRTLHQIYIIIMHSTFDSARACILEGCAHKLIEIGL